MAPALAQDALGLSGGSATQSTDKFDQLVNDLSEMLGPSSGLDSEDVDVKHLEELMTKYISKESEWQKYAFADFSRGYTRNLVDEGNGKSNLLVLVWTPGRGSPVHDHADAHCLMKVLKGTLCETRFSNPSKTHTSSSSCPKPPTPLEVVRETTYYENEVTYMADELGLHKISNPDPDRLAVSLHLYTPPNAARQGCNIFCEKTGRSSHITQSNFYSVFGRLV